MQYKAPTIDVGIEAKTAPNFPEDNRVVKTTTGEKEGEGIVDYQLYQ